MQLNEIYRGMYFVPCAILTLMVCTSSEYSLIAYMFSNVQSSSVSSA